jgi:hypothetical protein
LAIVKDLMNERIELNYIIIIIINSSSSSSSSNNLLLQYIFCER